MADPSKVAWAGSAGVDDCRSRCLDEYTAFEAEKRKIAAEYSDWSLGMLDTIPVPLESLFFALDDVEKGRHRPPFMILDAVEMPSPSTHVECCVGLYVCKLQRYCKGML